jgi:hypothetical protein
MGFPPPVNIPPGRPSASADVGFEPAPAGATICGFGIPGFILALSVRFPLPTWNFPPDFNFMIGLNCDLANPISAKVKFGGGRAPNNDPDPFEEND